MSLSGMVRPIDFLYEHLHESIRRELDLLGKGVLDLGTSIALGRGNESHARSVAHSQLLALQDRYGFLEQVYKYHSLVEDEVVYPLLDSKVKNVVLPYTVEHEDEERLFEELTGIIGQAVAATSGSRAWEEGASAIRHLTYKVEEVHTCIRRHLAKEEEQLHPLLIAHCSHDEQASLVAQFLFCIPLAGVGRVLTWLREGLQEGYREDLTKQILSIFTGAEGDILRRLVTGWLTAGAPTSSDGDATDGGTEGSAASAPTTVPADTPSPSPGRSPIAAAAAAAAAPPVLLISLVHDALRASLDEFIAGVRSLRSRPHPWSLSDLQQLVDRHRYLRAVCTFHAESENDVVLPILNAIRQRGAGAASAVSDAAEYSREHASHVEMFEDLGRLLMESVLHTRRATSKAAEVSGRLMDRAEHVCRVVSEHMREEEEEVLPLLSRELGLEDQRRLVWRTLKAMPLRLLSRVLPLMGSIALSRGAAALTELRNLVALAGREQGEHGILELFILWMDKGVEAGEEEGGEMGERGRGVPIARAGARAGEASPGPLPLFGSSPLTAENVGPPAKKPKLGQADVGAGGGGVARVASGHLASTSGRDAGGAAAPSSPQASASAAEPQTPRAAPSSFNPIDHIFQFHKALRQELALLESDAASLDPRSAAPAAFQAELQRLDGRFQFLWGIYRAHSKAEDEVIFPALESREMLHNVSHAYVLDHMEEEKLFIEFDRAISSVRSTPPEDSETRVRLTERLRGICAAIRASIDTHVRSEEMGLWPLFVEHFTAEEQEQLVGTIIGKTGAEALNTMLGWVTKFFNEEERGEIIESLRLATRNTMFDRWLDATFPGRAGGGDGEGGAEGVEASETDEGGVHTLEELAQYLRAQCPAAVGPSAAGAAAAAAAVGEAPGAVEDRSQFRPGWEDIFRMNQAQLERAVRALSSDPNLEPQRKAYLLQNLMASKYIVAQQMGQRRRAGQLASTPSDPTGPSGSSASVQPGWRQSDTAAPGGAAAGAAAAAAPAARRGCEHYERQCSIIAPCCGRQYPCRLCHDANEDHKVDRYAIKEMSCSSCGCRQPVAQDCRQCSARLSRYYCGICHLWDDAADRDIYHCPFCNVCRRGKGLGVDFFHCMTCNSCMSLSLFNKHTCRHKSLEANCPVCHEYLFDSSSPVKELRCGHFLHSNCFEAYKSYSYTCPVCYKSMGDMAVYFEMLDALIAAEEPLPQRYQAARQQVHCNDCGKDSVTAFHFVYHKCPAAQCRSYNTRVLSTWGLEEGGTGPGAGGAAAAAAAATAGPAAAAVAQAQAPAGSG